MSLNDFFDLLFPGDKAQNVPAFRACDDRLVVDGFLKSVPQGLVDELKGIDPHEKTPDEMLKELKSNGRDMRPVINDALSFYFSRPAVVVPLTGRKVPLTSSGIAKF